MLPQPHRAGTFPCLPRGVSVLSDCLNPRPGPTVSTAPRDDRIDARAQLEYVAKGLYADHAAALRAMRQDAHREGAQVVRRKLEEDFRTYGLPRPDLHGQAGERAQQALRVGGIGAEVEHWLALDHTPAQPRMIDDAEINRVMQAPDAEALGDHRVREDHPGAAADPKELLSPEERLVYEQLDAYAAARGISAERQAAEARLHMIADHREHLRCAEEKLPEAKAALRREVEETFGETPRGLTARFRTGTRENSSAMDLVEAAIERDGPAETARRVRSRELLGDRQKAITTPNRVFGFRRRDSTAEVAARDRVAKRIETLGYYEGDLGKWSSFQPQDGPPVTGAKNVRAALDREEARVLVESGLGPRQKEIEGRRPVAPHPSIAESQSGNAARRALERLSPESRDRIANVAQRAGADRITAALAHLQMIQTVARTFREGVEPPGG